MKARLPQAAKAQGGTDMNSMVRRAQKMQDDIKSIQDAIAEEDFTEEVGDGRVKVVMSGGRVLKAVKFSDEFSSEIKSDSSALEELEDLIIAGVNALVTKIDDETAERIEKVTDGINLPGLI